MRYKAEVDVMPLEALLDPQGKTVKSGLKNLGHHNFKTIRVGKHVTLFLEADSKIDADEMVKSACEKLLANPVIESFKYELTEQS